ncbi:hypothetical protein JVU11DRAFT_2001 [Chiua virens]|nr:hypothetical protein JVU11DRAFT_2001 [Chiua virens]
MSESHPDSPSRACRCLNVRIWPLPGSQKYPDFLMPAAADSEYALTYVGDKGIAIAHPQVTMRTRKIGPPVADSSRCIRFTTLTCLLCQTVAYRVQQLVASDVDGQEGPLLPSPDWVEQETLLSSCGWIEVHQDCLFSADVTHLTSSSSYSSLFGVALPQKATPPATSPQLPYDSQDPKESHSQTSAPAGPFLYSLKPLFPPAPFVPTHPVFVHLLSIAVKASEHLRSQAEEEIAAIVRDKFGELEKAEDALRHNVEDLWRKFVQNMGRGNEEARQFTRPFVIHLEHLRSASGLRSEFRSDAKHGVESAVSSIPSSRVSTLSVSLANSGFHNIHMVQEPTEARERSSSGSPRSPPPYSSHPSSLGSADGSISSSLQSSPELSPRVNGDSIGQPFKRSMDETRDTAVSFRYFTILEADMARVHHQQDTSQPKSEGTFKTDEVTKENGNSIAQKVTVSTLETEEGNVRPPENSDRVAKAQMDGTPRRRKVKFDITAEAETGVGASSGTNGTRGNEELIFDLEDGSSEPESSDAAPTLPFVENAQARHRGRHRVPSLGALPPSLSSLRPTSLPAYSVLQSSAAEEPVRNVTASVASYPSLPVLLHQEPQSEYPEQLDPQEEEILRLVAANTPSHRNAWKRNSKAWQLFVSRRRNGVPGALIPEETEDASGRVADDADDSGWDSSRDVRWHGAFPASLPMDINRAGTIVPAFRDSRRHTSSHTLRRASYAERDRSRAIDPGALDFIEGTGGEAEDDESDEDSNKANVTDEGRGRQRALKILEARSKVPEAGMWMSLA